MSVEVTRNPCGDAVNTSVVSLVSARADEARTDTSRSADIGINRAVDVFIEVSLVWVSNRPSDCPRRPCSDTAFAAVSSCMYARPDRSVDWANLELFLAVARGGSLASAASTLRVDASTVHRRIASLEEALRTRLFARSPRGYALTNAGHELLPYATAMDEQATAARRKLAGRDEALTGTVRVSAVHDGAGILSPILASFRAKHPGVTVAVDMRSAFADLARQQADVALRVSTRAPEGDLVAKHVAKLAVAFYASRAYLTRQGRPERVEDLRDHAIVRGDE